ncbi:MAG: hypothetical protein WBB82_03140 [Limnothrix sp.]
MNKVSVRTIKQQIQMWFGKTTVAETRDDLISLPDVLQNQLIQEIRALSSPEAYQVFVREELDQAIAAWQENLDAPNSLVFLGSPVEAIAEVLNDSMEPWQYEGIEVITPLSCVTRPKDSLKLTEQFSTALKPYVQLNSENQTSTDEELDSDDLDIRKTVVVIPCLEKCFLRCIGGWESIEYLRDMAIKHNDCFWVIGCSHWAWGFLNFVCQVSAYFSEIKSLPKLDGEMLREWLNPVVKTMIATKEDADQEDSSQDYWKSLADRALGVSTIAASLWLQSLRVEENLMAAAEEEDQQDLSNLHLGETPQESQVITFQEVKPSLPSLPILESGDRYLLHSLLIHGQMTRAHLAFSLGQQENQIQSQIQALLRAGLLERKNGELLVSSSHYVRLKNELGNNNFFVGDD